MSVRGRFQMVRPDDAECSLTLTMTLKEWKELRGHLTDKYPSWQVGQAISKMVYAAETHFHTEKELA